MEWCAKINLHKKRDFIVLRFLMFFNVYTWYFKDLFDDNVSRSEEWTDNWIKTDSKNEGSILYNVTKMISDSIPLRQIKSFLKHWVFWWAHWDYSCSFVIFVSKDLSSAKSFHFISVWFYTNFHWSSINSKLSELQNLFL